MATRKPKTSQRAGKGGEKRAPRKAARPSAKKSPPGGRVRQAKTQRTRRQSGTKQMVDEADSLPRFTVAFIDSAGCEHAATALAPDPGVALSGLLEKAAELGEPWLDDLVAVVVSHPTTWQSVREGVLELFER